MDKPLAEAPVFFLPVSLLWEYFGAPAGTGLFRAVANQKKQKLGISDKTLRKLLEADGKYSKKSAESFVSWLESISGEELSRKIVTRKLKAYNGRRMVEVGWRIMLEQLSNGQVKKLFPKTLGYVHKVLDEETAYFQFTIENKNKIDFLLRARQAPSFYTQYALAVPEEYYQDLIPLPSDKAFERMWSDPVFFRSSMHGMVSLHMDFFAHAEIEWLAKKREKDGTTPIESQLEKLLPRISESEAVGALPSYFELIKEHFGITWHQMSEHLINGQNDDPESKRRSLMRWVKGDVIPSFEIFAGFHQRLFQDEPYDSHMDLGLLAIAVRFIDRLLKEFLGGCGHPAPPSEEEIVFAFSSYSDHFEKHRAVLLESMTAA